MFRNPCLVVAVFGCWLSLLWFNPLRAQMDERVVKDPSRIDIVRDSFGVPHIYAPTDAEVAYGLAWANAEDDPITLQHMLAISEGKAGKLLGVDGAIFDFFMGLMRIPKHVDSLYATVISPRVDSILRAYCQGMNDWAAAHPDQVIDKSLLPVKPQHICRGYTLTVSLFTGLPFVVQHILEGKIDDYQEGYYLSGGSNAIAVAPNKMADGKTTVVVNSHQPLEGLFSWYEAHLSSEEGLEIIGGTFPGGAFIFHGTTPSVAWANTFNWPDVVDFFRLEINPKSPKGQLQYRYDGQWLTLEENHVPLRVRPKKWMPVVKVKKKAWWSVHGPVVKGKDGHYYALRTASYYLVGVPEFMHKLNNVRNLDDFRAALEMQQLPLMNYIYGDADGNILYLSNAVAPIRHDGWNWKGVLPGDTSAVVVPFENQQPLEMLPQKLNPDCGYVFNTNNTPLNCTCADENPYPDDYPSWMGLQMLDNNRSRRMSELFNETLGKQITLDELKTLKNDLQFPRWGAFIESLNWFLTADPGQYPEVAEGLRRFQNWNFRADTANRDIPVVYLTILNMFDAIGRGSADLEEGFRNVTPEVCIAALRKAQKHLKKHFGRLDVPFGQMNRHIRGAVNLPAWGIPDVIAAEIGTPQKDGTYKIMAGESYIMYVQFDPNTRQVSLETVHAYGSSSVPTSPHYTDQMEMFLAQKTKPMTFDRATIYNTAKRIYHPVK
jgi:acyl-homoserine-lactone acylase